MKLDSRAAAAGVRLVAHEVLGSTSAQALSLARSGECGPLWVTAREQTAGRGRRGRAWISPPDNLYATLLLSAPGPTETWPQLSFVAALAVHDAVAELAANCKPLLAIKWPNDLLLGGSKFAGILIEDDGGNGRVAIGFGVNCTTHPADTDYPATDIAAAGARVSPQALFTVLSRTMLDRLAQWNAGHGFATTRTDWLARAAGLGSEIMVRVAEGSIGGRFEALDPAGNLMLRLPDGGIKTIAAGDVMPASLASPRRAS
jgi:BirA family transcriptional regulator, biotin operon repressor / biotin---[acetyl-CoA-carboxylase] ligase